MAARKQINTSADVNTATPAESFMKTTEKEKSKPPKKERRVQLLILADEWTQFQSLAHLAGTNCNAMLCNFVHYSITQYGDQIRKYQKQRDLMRQELNIIEEDKPHE